MKPIRQKRVYAKQEPYKKEQFRNDSALLQDFPSLVS
jgi:hypothetical protein